MGDKHVVRFEPVGIEIEVDEEQTVLRAAFDQGLMLMHGCKEGQCSACKSFLLDGDDVELDKYSTFALPDFEREEGFTLLCRAHVYEDVTIELLNFDEEMIRSGLPVTDAVAEVPGGAHFTSCPPDYDRDESFQKTYAGSAADPETWKSFSDRYLQTDEAGYQAAVAEAREWARTQTAQAAP